VDTTSEWEEIFLNHTSDRGECSEHVSNSKNLLPEEKQRKTTKTENFTNH
jgi:hypothetical protein